MLTGTAFNKTGNAEVDAIAISHCHHDHVGALPVALRHFPKAHVLMTELSYFIVERVLHNSVNVMTRQRDELGIREYPLTRTTKWTTSRRNFRASNTTAKSNGGRSTNARGTAVADAGIF
jgi:Cft2 family RNA processing exonuclease